MNNQNLIKRIEENRDMRDRIKRREADHTSRVKTIREAAEVFTTDFWCDRCDKDYTGTGYKREGWLGNVPTAWYVGKCLCGRQSIRRITDKHKDIYYYVSKKIKFQRVRNYNDMLTPADDLFKIIYPKEYERLTRREKGQEEGAD